jgi:diguanylate cyclase (GGDEF)-like protein/putative nucleotidyltransferase with HDIG domain
MSLAARTFTTVLIILGLTVLGPELLRFDQSNMSQFAAYLVLALLASVFRVGLNTQQGRVSLNVFFVPLGLVALHPSQALVLACGALGVESWSEWTDKEEQPAPMSRLGHALFSLATAAIAVSMGEVAYKRFVPGPNSLHLALQYLLTGATYFVGVSFPGAFLTTLQTQRRSLGSVWKERHLWQLPYYVGSTVLAGLLARANETFHGWQIPMLAFLAGYLIYRSYRLYMGRLEDGRTHAEEVASLHLRTIEALALAIDAKDETTHDHLMRVQVYALEIAKDLGLSESDTEALRAASLLHDIGKLAVPEHIISKPGRLTPEEFEKMKIHPVVGAEILERVKFPYPVVPIVRSHHERWDGSGYPDGLKGEAIPVGARILAVVDCLDALASDRQYRKALPLDQAIGVVVQEAGRSFDPRIVEVLARRYIELEKMAAAHTVEPLRLSKDLKVEAGEAPAAGFVGTGQSSDAPAVERADFLQKIAAARQEAHTLFELAQSIGNSLSLDETLSVVSVRLRRLVPFDAMAVYVRDGDHLVTAFATGENARLFSELRIPVGQGLSGWVAENDRPILNGNPSVEPGYLNDRAKFSTLRSALAVPLEGVQGVVAVLALYRSERDGFTRDHLGLLQAVSSKLSLSIENALRYHQAETSATTDFLTNLPNARSLFLHLEAEIERCRGENSPLAVLVCDIDNFKQINDEYGHVEGNRALRSVATALRSRCRGQDYVARMGGDEFVLVLPGLPPENVEARTGGLRRIVLEQVRLEVGFELHLSVGAATLPEDGQDAETLLSSADRVMYKAKRSKPRDLRGASAPSAGPVDDRAFIV